MMKYFLWLLMFLMTAGFCMSQPSKEWQEQYEKNIKREYVNDVYIPKDIDEAISELKSLGDAAGLLKFQNADEEEITRRLHFGLGRWIQHNWNLYDGSRYSHYLKETGIAHPDDMTEFTIVSLHRALNQKPLEVEKRVADYIARRKLEAEKRKNKG